ncbi:hypothetical protein ACT6NV_12565 [Robiginitalea sp. IMCC44478]|uniref:hypothetical protein n=1 Tax=Robiginitalea sp. IMCC44478 TaxID=3459122 RepID=UPI004041814E
MNSENIMNKEIGSYFHWIDSTIAKSLFKKHPINFRENTHVFYSGRHALKYLINHIEQGRSISKIWMPEYYCQHVTNWMKKNYSNIHLYSAHPFEYTDELRIPEDVSENDILIINNYWGLSTTRLSKYPAKRPIIIEDHSHGWLSRQCLHSEADYCFVSLRKSLPIPLGGICWAPNKELPSYPLPENQEVYSVWDKMVVAMKNKTEYLYGQSEDLKDLYLNQIAEVEDGLDLSHKVTKMRTEDKKFIHKWLQLDVLEIKKRNLDLLYRKITDTPNYKIIKRFAYTSFGFMLLFSDGMAYESFRKHLIDNQIYPSNLWPNNNGWKYFLNVHVDFRYGIEDMEFIAGCIEDWNRTYN